MAAILCSFTVLVLCLHLVGAIPGYNPGARHVDETMSRSPPRSRHEETSARLGAGMTHDGIDMALTQQQYDRLFKGTKERSGGRTAATPWKDGIIPYEIKPGDFDDAQLQWLQRAMRHWEEFTCVRFRPATPDDYNRVRIETGQGCWAHLGMGGGTQIINLNKYCFWIGIIEHELGHTLGLIHEHQRPERDAYIRVNYFGVQTNFVDAIQKYAVGSDDKMGLAYDYTSVMHYGKGAFSEHKYLQTVFTRDPTYSDVIGMTLRPSFLDYKLINLMYQCADKCDARSKPVCGDDCFLNAECQCICKEDIPKENCQDKKDMCPTWRRWSECHGKPWLTYTDCRKSCGICKTDGTPPQFPCLDGSKQCKGWADKGDCENKKDFMFWKCRKICGVCTEDEDNYPKGRCRDANHTCGELAKRGECVRDPVNMLRDCTKSCDFCPEHVGRQPARKPGHCQDFDGVCAYWAANNLCQRHYTWMYLNCRKSCGFCDTHLDLPSDCIDKEEKNCHEWGFKGSCREPDFRERCKLTCDACDGIAHPNPQCVDYNRNCADWASRYECYGNPDFMTFACPKSCEVCPGDPPTPAAPCIDFKKNCGWWESIGECQKNPGWMNLYCRWSCKQCTN